MASVKVGGTKPTKCTTHQNGEPFKEGQRVVLPASVRSHGTGGSAILIESVGELGNGDRIWLADPIRGTVFQLKVCEKDILAAEVEAIVNRKKRAEEAAEFAKFHAAEIAEETAKKAKDEAVSGEERERRNRKQQKEIEQAAEKLIMKRAKAAAVQQEKDDALAAGGRHLELED